MKILFAALISAFVTQAAMADFVPGRVRATAVAKLQVKAATGIYKNLRKATIAQLKPDGLGVVGYHVEIDGQVVRFEVTDREDTGCGEVIAATSLEMMNNTTSSELALKDMSNAKCEVYVDKLWTVQIETYDFSTKKTSKVLLVGNPEHRMVTLGN